MRHIQDIREKGIDYDKSQHMQQFGIQVDRQLTVLEGRVLPLPKITQRKNITLPVRADDGNFIVNFQFINDHEKLWGFEQYFILNVTLQNFV